MYIQLINYTKVINGITVLDNINLRFEQGRIYGLNGKSGSGKTMFIRAIVGLIRPTSGEICINGEILGKDISSLISVGVLIENPSFLDPYTGFDNLKMLSAVQGKIKKDQIKEAMSSVGLDPEDKSKYINYSLGMKQRLGIAAAIMGKPDIILLDEPLNLIDEKGVENIKQTLFRLRDEGKLIIMVGHDKKELEYLSDEIIYIKDGKIV